MMKTLQNKGFTIIELLIATSVFAVILLILTSGIMQIGRVYYRGVTGAQTQEVARSVVDDVKEAIQLSGGTVNLGLSGGGYSAGYCIGSRLYMFNQYRQLTTTSGPALTSENVTNGCGSVTSLPPAGPITNQAERLNQKMRIANFSVASAGGNLYNITLRIVTGDNDMLCSPTYPGNTCASGTMPSAAELNRPDLRCKGVKGMQYCAVSEISTTVTRRVN